MLMQSELAIPAELAETVDRLENWGRWAREYRAGTIIGSAEGRYRPERGDLEPRRQPAPFIDSLDAQLVGKVLAHAGGFPHRWYVLLKWKYHLRAKPSVLCRKMAVHPDNFHLELRKALFAARNVLTRRRNAA